MSGLDRKAARADARLVLRGLGWLAGYTEMSAWAQKVDVDTLPAWAVATPNARREAVAHDLARDEFSLLFVIKQVGGETIEDDLDDAADAVVPVVIGALRSLTRECDLTSTEARIDGDGEARVGTLSLIFTVRVWTGDPS
jgi:hypothetical protein